MVVSKLSAGFVEQLERLAAARPALGWALVLAATALLALGDLLTGADIVFTPLYFVPISFGAWFGGRRLAAIAAVLATASWAVVDMTDHADRSLAVYLWSLVVQALVFGTIAALVPALRAALTTARAGRADAERELEHAQRLTTVGSMAAGIAHELGTPLNVAGAYARMIRDGGIAGDKVRSAAGIVEQQVQFMVEIIRKLLDFARAQEPRRTRQALPELVSAAVSLLAPVVKHRNVELTVEHAPGLGPVELDGGQLAQVLSNLIMNAAQASPEGGRVRVRVSEATRAAPPELESSCRRWAVISVRDEGTGIAPEVLPHIFDPFFTTKPVGEGTGLGLAVAWGLVRKHGGWIAVESAPGQGSRFSVYLPSEAGAGS